MIINIFFFKIMKIFFFRMINNDGFFYFMKTQRLIQELCLSNDEVNDQLFLSFREHKIILEQI